ncbi:MAG: Protein-export membrane protein SecD [Methanonatronarchaeales archaeon]|nr:Protein-export membrane protein SecD [Methanonatronarchaeales archaeon]
MKGLRPALEDRRVLLLLAVVAVSLVLIGPTYSDGEVETNLRYGLELQGGVWMQLQVKGATVTGSVDVPGLLQGRASEVLDRNVTVSGRAGVYELRFEDASNESLEALRRFGEASLSDGAVRLNVSETALVSDYLGDRLGGEVRAVSGTRGFSYEVRTEVTREEAEAAFRDAGGELSEFERGVSDRTLETTREVIEKKVNAIGLRDISVRTAGSRYILVDMAGNITLDRGREVVSRPGRFELRVETEAGEGVNESIHALWGDEILGVDFPTQDRDDAWGVPFTLSEQGGEDLRSAVLEAGAAEPDSGKNILMLLDDEVVYSAPIATDLKEDFRRGTVRSIRANTGSGDEGQEAAKNLEIHLKVGALPVDVDVVSSGEVSAELGENFKTMSLVAGVLALLAVSLVTFLRYREPVVSATMLLVAFSEVLVLLGVSSVLQDLTLPALAGIVITVGTGIDHLIMISDEVLEGGRVPTYRTFAKRLSRANWIIYGAAFTTIIAMTPLYIMGLGRLSGFAIMTIIGVLVGILVTRPAYGRLIYILLRGSRR